MKKLDLTAISAACLLALSTGAIGAMTKAEHKAAAGSIAATYTSDKSACKSMGGNAKDVCMQEAKGRDSVARAELEAAFSPSDKHHYDVRIAKAEAAYAVSKEKCDDFAGNAKDVCRKEATSAHVAATANAKVAEKSADANAAAAAATVDANATARAKTNDAIRDADADKRDADYAVAKEKCDAYSGDAKASCITDAKLRYGQS